MKHYGYCPYADLKAEQPLAEPTRVFEPKPFTAKRPSRAEEGRTRRKELLIALRADPEHERHGTISGYQAGCRCDKCWNAYLESKERRKERGNQ